MTTNLPTDPDAVQRWVEIAQGTRMMDFMLKAMPDPGPDSNFAQIDALYPHEKASAWHRSYLGSALEHLMLWADVVAPLKFHEEHVTVFTFRPAHTLGRAAMEAASQALWMTSGGTAHECARRHLALIRWDYEEYRKSNADKEFKTRVTERDKTLVERAAPEFSIEELRAPGHLEVLRKAAPAADLDPDEVEYTWRAASGAAHGRVWPALVRQHVLPTQEYEEGHYRTLRIPDTAAMTEVLNAAETMMHHGVLRHADFCGADIELMLQDAARSLAEVVPLKDGVSPDDVRNLLG